MLVWMLLLVCPVCFQSVEWRAFAFQMLGKDKRQCRAGAMRAQEIDRLPEGKAKGVGMCVGPIFSSTPTALDWLQYYAGKTLPQCTCRLNEYLQHQLAHCQAASGTHVSLGCQCTATCLSAHACICRCLCIICGRWHLAATHHWWEHPVTFDNVSISEMFLAKEAEPLSAACRAGSQRHSHVCHCG
jgi:hypothetical protein